MSRRHFLKLATTTTAGIFAGRFLVLAETPTPVDLQKVISKARNAGRPLVVIVIPSDRSLQYRYGTILGAYLNFASNADLALLAMSDVVCASIADINKLKLSETIPETSILALLTPETDFEAAISLPCPAGETAAFPGNEDKTYEDFEKRMDAIISQRSAGISEFITSNLGGSHISTLAGQARTHLPENVIATLTDPELNLQKLSDDTLRSGAAILLESTVNKTSKDPALTIQAVAESIKKAIIQNPPTGARWARSTGCGTTIEGESDDWSLMVACGMGCVPAKESRFLYLLTDKDTP